MIEWQQQQHQQHQGDEGGKRMKSMIFQMDFSAIQIQFRMVHQIVVHCDWILVITLALDRAYFIPKNICTMKGFYTPWIDHSIFEYNVTIKTKAKSKSIELLTKRKHKATLNGKGIRFYSFSLLRMTIAKFLSISCLLCENLQKSLWICQLYLLGKRLLNFCFVLFWEFNTNIWFLMACSAKYHHCNRSSSLSFTIQMFR